MKKSLILVLFLIAAMGPFNMAAAQSRGSHGALLGAGSGALLGQAIGRDTEATLLGTAIGGVLGYMVGNEMDKSHTIRTRTVIQPSPAYDSRVWQREGRGQHYTEYRDERECREAEILATVNGRPKKILADVCREDGRWVVQNDSYGVDRTVFVERTEYIPKTSVVFWRDHDRRHRRWYKRNHYRRTKHLRRHHAYDRYDW